MFGIYNMSMVSFKGAMTMSYDPATTMRQARATYFEDNGFGAGGGYEEPWVDFKLGPLPFPFPNSAARTRTVPYHDIHHVLTGYRTDFPGETEISAWELGAGCKDFWVAWHLNLSGAAAGAFFMPRKVFRAFVRGRASRSLYGLPMGELLEGTVAEARDRAGITGAEGRKASMSDALLFAAVVASGTVLGALTFALFLPLLPVGLVTLALRKMRQERGDGGKGEAASDAST